MYIEANKDTNIRVLIEEDNAKEDKDKENKEVSDNEKLEILKEMHESPIGGQARMNKTYTRLRHFVNWKRVKNDVENFIQKCEKCQKNRMTQCHIRLPLTITDTPSTVFEKCTVDIVGPLSPSMAGNRYILTVQGELS
jgi:hypothetical protein